MPDKVDEKLDDNVVTESSVPGVTIEDKNKTDEDKKTLTLSVEELNKKIQEAVAAAGKESSQKEKTKLYDTIATLKKENSDIQEKLKIYDSKKLEEDKKLDEERKAKMNPNEVIDEQIKKANLEVEQLKFAFQKLQEETDNKLKQKDVELFKEKLIATANGEIIPELVVGTTMEEVSASFEVGKKRFLEIKGQVSKEIETVTTQQSKTTVSQETPQTKKPITKDLKELSAEEVKNLSQAEFNKYKEEVLSKHGF